jgi:hypothetical protein
MAQSFFICCFVFLSVVERKRQLILFYSMIDAVTQLAKSIFYIYKEECLSVLYALSPCDSYDHQTFHDASLSPKEGRNGVNSRTGVGRGLGEISPR